MSEPVPDTSAWPEMVGRFGSHWAGARVGGDVHAIGLFISTEGDNLRRGNLAGWLAIRDLSELIDAHLGRQR
jgi:hypothetical protein